MGKTIEHDWYVHPGHQIRSCWQCGAKEAYWDDEDYPINPCIPKPENSFLLDDEEG